VIGGVSGLISGGAQDAFAAAIGATIGEMVGEQFEGAHQDDVYDHSLYPLASSYDVDERKAMVAKAPSIILWIR